MNGLKRNLYYWGVILHKQFWGLILYVLFFVCFFGFSNGGDVKKEMMEIIPTYFVMLVIMIPLLNGLNTCSNVLPITISFGTTRKVAYTAMQIMQHLIMIEFLLISALVFYWGDSYVLEVATDNIFALLGLILTVIAIANITAAINYKKGTLAAVIVYVLTLVLVVFAIVGIGIVSDRTAIDQVMMLLLNMQYLGIIGVLLDLATGYVFYKVFLGSNLKF